MARGRAPDVDGPDAPSVPPVELRRLADASRTQESAESEGRKPTRVWITRSEALHRPIVEVVIVIVREQDDVDRGEIVKRNGRRHPATRPGKANRRGPLAPHRVREDVDPTDLDEERRVPHPG